MYQPSTMINKKSWFTVAKRTPQYFQKYFKLTDLVQIPLALIIY